MEPATWLPTEIDSIRRAMEHVEKAAAKDRMLAGKAPSEKFAGGQTRDKIGAFVGVSGRTARWRNRPCSFFVN